jgi:taurine--2-oxoglutarate transaminase
MTDEKQYVLHTWTRQADWNGATVIGGSGAWFHDVNGKRYLDLSSQAECCNLGHQHPSVVRAIQKQAAALCYVSNSWGAAPRAELAGRIVAIANGECAATGNQPRERPGMPGEPALGPPPAHSGFGKVFFTCDGAEATENAIKMARWFTGRRKILSRYRSYHGATHAAMKAGGDARGWSTEDGLTGVVHLLPPYCFRCPFGLRYPSCGIRCAVHVEDVILLEGAHTVAAIIAEPAAGTNGIIPPAEYWPRLREICDRHGILLIADEVMSGFGRCGEWFAWQRLGAEPDMFTMAKGLTGAHIPLGAVCVRSRVAAYFDDHPLEAGLTYSGHPLACAAGVAAIRAYEDGKLVERSKQLGLWMLDRLREMQGRHEAIADVRGLGLFAVLEMNDAGRGVPVPPFPGPLPWLRQLARAALDRGVSIAVRGNLVIVCPPLVIDQEEIGTGLSVMESLL